jgi:hypothetical protein
MQNKADSQTPKGTLGHQNVHAYGRKPVQLHRYMMLSERRSIHGHHFEIPDQCPKETPVYTEICKIM